MAEPADSLAAERPSSVAGTSPPRGPVPSDAERASAAAMAARLAPGEPTAPPDPLTIRQWLWGPGLHIPGTAEDVLALARPFAATAATRLLDVAAGPARRRPIDHRRAVQAGARRPHGSGDA